MSLLQPTESISPQSYPPNSQSLILPETFMYKDLGGGYVLRTAHVDEFDQVGNALVAAFTDGCWITPEYEAGLHKIGQRARSADVWVIVDEGDRIVAAVLTPKPDCYKEAAYTFNILGVAPWGRGHGFGSVLVHHCIAIAEQYGFATIELHSSPQMTHAHRLYYSFGFHRRIDWETMVVDSGQRLLSLTRDVSWKKNIWKEDAMQRPHEIIKDVETVGISPSHLHEELTRISRRPNTLNISLSILDPRAWSTLFALRLSGESNILQSYVTVDTEHIPTGDESHPVRVSDERGAIVTDDWRLASRIVEVVLSGGDGGALYSSKLSESVDQLVTIIDNELTDGLFEVINANNDAKRDAYRRIFYARLGWLDYILSNRTFLTGEKISDADGHLFGVLLTFDIGYRNLFPDADAAVLDYPHLWAYARRLYALQGLVTAEEKYALGLLSKQDESTTLPWGEPAYTETAEDIAAAWNA
ncbi:MAG: GNAT family N-acetyltransferase [Bifidobacterium psychraerophilum]|uniref:GNAT family N-acetyltransferase n=1 Tax=Bifidobacterium psychraerophilum TaxID=218140 RepID=UPI0039E7C86B